MRRNTADLRIDGLLLTNGTVPRFMTSRAFVNSVLAGRWEFYPGMPHPRGLSGCNFWTSWEVTSLLGIDFCSEASFRSLRYFCPVSCHCSPQGGDGCPDSCAYK